VSSKESVEAIHQKLAAELDLDEILVCYHTDDDHCECRKPKPGLLLDAARRHQINLAESFMVGDRWRDVEAGQNAGCRTILIDAGYQERKPGQPPTVRVHSLQEAADWILEENAMGVTR
jgi:D-glycero-D-manno-heptose 1,7-bisphosphate phosphatase